MADRGRPGGGGGRRARSPPSAGRWCEPPSPAGWRAPGASGTAAATTVLGAYSPVPAAGWVGALPPAGRGWPRRWPRRLRRQSALAFGAALLLIALLLAVAWAAVVRPIRDLAREQRELAGGAAGRAPGGDEIADLRRSFEALRRGLAERRALDDVFLGRYQVIELLATGGMGAVFRGWDPRLQRPVALKTLRLGGRPAAREAEPAIEQLVREAVTAARFSHPNVVAVYDVEDAPEGAYIAMELVDGMSLERLLVRRGRLRPAEVILLGAAIARGLAAAHARDIVHRDVKPANVMLGRDGSIKVTDFGIADLIAASAQADGTGLRHPRLPAARGLRGGGARPRRRPLRPRGRALRVPGRGQAVRRRPDVATSCRPRSSGHPAARARRPGDLPPELETLVGLLLERELPAARRAPTPWPPSWSAWPPTAALRWRLDPGTEDARSHTAEPFKAQWVPTTRLDRPRTEDVEGV